MSQGRLFLGLDGEASILQANAGRTDHGALITHQVTTYPFAPAGAGGEAMFTGARIVVRHDVAFTLTLQLLVDGAEHGDPKNVTVPGPALIKTTVLEINLGYASELPSGRVIGRFYPRGTWGQLRIELANVGAGLVDIEPPELEHEIVASRRRASA